MIYDWDWSEVCSKCGIPLHGSTSRIRSIINPSKRVCYHCHLGEEQYFNKVMGGDNKI